MTDLAKTFCLAIAISILVFSSGVGAFEVGDIYDGEFVTSGKNGVTVNIEPCGKASEVTIKYYRLTELGKVKCPGADGKVYRKVHVEEIAPPEPPKPAPKKNVPETPQRQ